MKIVFIVNGFPKLSETFILNQITGILDLGHNVQIFAKSKPKEKKVHSDVERYHLIERTHYIPKNRIVRLLKAIYLITLNFHKSPIKILKSLNILKYGDEALSLKLLYLSTLFLDKEYDIIYYHFGPNGIIGAKLKNLGIKGKLITTFHGYDMSLFILGNKEDIYSELFAKGDLFMPISNYWKKKLISLGCPKNKIIVHRMGINLEKFEYFERKKLSGEPIKILTVGRLVEKKGYEYAIRSMAKIVSKVKNVHYIIAGDGPLRKKLESLVSKLEINDSVKFMGAVKQDEVIKLYQQAHIFLLPSVTAGDGDQEGIPVVLMEAQATGLPIISTYHTGIPELVVDGKSGFLVPERDIQALAERIKYLIEHQELWPEMGRCGRKFVEKRYDTKKLNQKLVNIYQKLLEVN